MDRKKENILNKLKRTGFGFKVPKGYFENLEDRIDHVIDWDEADKKQAAHNLKKVNTSMLDNMEKKHGFISPEGYFESIESKLTFDKQPKVIPLNDQIKRILSLSIAAAILLIVGINYRNAMQNEKNQMVFQDEEFVNWVESDLVDLNSYEITEAYQDIELELAIHTGDDFDEYLNTLDIENLILENK